jgi:alcohol dehydrogenase (cytochrome c)
MRNTGKIASVLLVAGLMLSACQNSPKPSTTTPEKAPSTATPEKTSVKKDFPTFGYDYGNTRNVPFDQITKDNVKDLGVVWQVDFKSIDKDIPGGIQNFPIIVDGVLYATTSFNHVFAFDAVTGKQLWHWKPDKIGAFKNFGLNANRGIAYGDGKVYMLLVDNRIVSIDAKTGKTDKMVNISDSVPGAVAEDGYYETSAPIFYKGNLYIGSSGADNGVRGFVMAYKADLTPAWDQPLWTIPPKGTDWLKGDKFQGGGTVWMPVTIDTETDIMYFATGNPAPDFYGADRPGENKWTDSVLAVESKTGKLIWGKQQISHDLWDYDSAASPLLMKATVNGKERKVVVEGTKAAQWWAYDAATGETIYDGVPFGKIDHPTPTPEGVLASPGVLGGQNYAPETYDPKTNYVLIPGVEQPMIVKVAKNTEEIVKNNQEPGAVDFGTAIAIAPETKATGTVTAIDLNTGKVVYQKTSSQPMRGGFTSNANSIAFYGEGDGNFNAIDIKTGENLWKFQTGAPIAAAPSIFHQDGKDYVAIAVGGTTTAGGGKTSKLMVFALGGDKTQMKPAEVVNSFGHGPSDKNQDIPKEGTWITQDKEKKVVNVLMVASYDATLSGMNFNGYGNGDMKVTVPKGWSVNMFVQNKNGQIPHSVMITPESVKGTVKDFKEAFKGASTPSPDAGFVGNDTQSFSFTADAAGTYLIWCAVPGHGTMGMYDTLIVDDKATEASISVPKK